MSMIVSFESCGIEREVAKLGSLEVGSVIVVPGRKPSCQWRVQLGLNAAQGPKPAQSVPAARRALVYRVAELFECAGPAFLEIAHHARAQADQMVCA